MASTSSYNFILPIRIVQAVFTIIVLGLTAYVANWWGSHWYQSSPSEVNFMLFTSVWTILTLVYLIIAPWKMPNHPAAHKFVILAAEALAMLFWFAGFIALAVFLTDRLCFGRVCDAAKAATAFGAFEWLLFAGTTGMAALHCFRTRGRNEPRADPNMEVKMEGV